MSSQGLNFDAVQSLTDLAVLVDAMLQSLPPEAIAEMAGKWPQIQPLLRAVPDAEAPV